MDKFEPVSAIVPEDDDGKRLDAALGSLYPSLGLRARRRLWQWRRVLLDGRAAGPGACVRAGQRIELVDEVDEAPEPDASLWGEIHIAVLTAGYAAIFKPGGLPSARVCGSRNYSVEEYLRENWGRFAGGDAPLLCNRLDTGTSGLLLLAFGQEKLERFRMLESVGAVRKSYCALVRGAAPAELYLDNALNTSGRKKTLALNAPDPDAARHSAARRLAVFEHGGAEASLLDVLIRRGSRHQIRAHLACAGFPILGDLLYGGESNGAACNIMYLHHYRIAFEGFYAEIPPSWPLAAAFTASLKGGSQ